MIEIVGGIYEEQCLHPQWNELYGSAGRAISAITRLNCKSILHSYADNLCREVMEQRAAIENFNIDIKETQETIKFQYMHGLSRPRMTRNLSKINEPINITSDKILRFGMIEGDAVVDAKFAVYDPQCQYNPDFFSKNGSKAEHLALVLNLNEAKSMLNIFDNKISGEKIACDLAHSSSAEVVVIKMGPNGAIVYSDNEIKHIPSYITNNVWKIGSGDVFTALFAKEWMGDLHDPVTSAKLASKGTAYYCNNIGFPNENQINEFEAIELSTSHKIFSDEGVKVYLAGPFFTLAQQWLIEEVRYIFKALGLRVFSPFHDVGRGRAEDVVHKDIQAIIDCDLVYAIGDGLDSGTIFEVGFARSINKPVIFYSENESEGDKKMMQGTDCMMLDDFTTSVYHTFWKSATL